MTLYSLELSWIQSLQEHIRSPLLDFFFKGFSYIDSIYFVFLAIAFVWHIIDRNTGIKFFYIMLLSFVINVFCKDFFMLPRPCQIDPNLGVLCLSTYGFPSGAAQSAMLYVGIVFTETKKVFYKIAILIFAFLLCFSRIYLGVHFFTDILGGLAIGCILLFIYKKLFPIAKIHSSFLSFLFVLFLFVFFLCLNSSSLKIQSIPWIALGISVGNYLIDNKQLKPIKFPSKYLSFISVIIVFWGTYLVNPNLEILKTILLFLSGLWFCLPKAPQTKDL